MKLISISTGGRGEGGKGESAAAAVMMAAEVTSKHRNHSSFLLYGQICMSTSRLRTAGAQADNVGKRSVTFYHHGDPGNAHWVTLNPLAAHVWNSHFGPRWVLKSSEQNQTGVCACV